MADWQKSLGSAQTTVKFSLTNDELEKLISKQKLENTSGLFIHPAIDATFSFYIGTAILTTMTVSWTRERIL